MVAFSFDQAADGQQGRTRKPQLCPQGGPIRRRPKELEVDAVENDVDPLRRHPQVDQHVLERLADRGHRRRMVSGPADQEARHRELRNQVKVRAIGGDDNRLLEDLSQDGCGNAIGIEIERIQYVEVEAAAGQPAQRA